MVATRARVLTVRKLAMNQAVLKKRIEDAFRRLRSPTISNVCKDLKCSRSAVVAVRNGDPCLRPDYKPRRNVAKRDSMAERRAAVKALANTRGKRGARVFAPFMTCAAIQAALADQEDIHVTIETIRTDLKAVGMVNLVRPKESVYSDDKAVAARNEFASDPRWNSKTICNSLIFSDEVPLTVNDHSHPEMWVPGRDELVPREQKNTFNCTRIMAWGGMAVGWRSDLVFFDKRDDEGKIKTMNAAAYKLRCLSPNRAFLSKKGKLFIQDGVSSHRAKHVLNYMDAQGIKYVDKWPASSPQFNMIESVWAELKRRLSDYAPTNDVAQFKANAKAAWESIPQSMLDNHCRHFHTVIMEHRRKAALKQ